MIFDDFLKGREGDRSQDMNIYTFLVDLDVLSPFLQESRVVSLTNTTFQGPVKR